MTDNSPTNLPADDDFESFLARHLPQERRFEVVLDGTEIFEFRIVTDTVELQQIHADGFKFVKSIVEGRIGAAMKPYATKDTDVLAWVYYLHAYHTRRWVVVTKEREVEVDGEKRTEKYEEREERRPFDQARFMRFAREWAYGFTKLKDVLNEHVAASGYARNVDAVIAAKKD